MVVGVFVNAGRDYVEERRRELDLDLIQFHGDEDESALSGWPVKVIRALSPARRRPRRGTAGDACGSICCWIRFIRDCTAAAAKRVRLTRLERLDLQPRFYLRRIHAGQRRRGRRA